MKKNKSSLTPQEKPKKKNREQIKVEKQLNRSLTIVPSQTQQSLGLVSVEPSSGVWHTDMLFTKMLQIDGLVTLPEEKRKEFTNILTDQLNIRVRMSSFIHDDTADCYLTLFASTNNYAVAKEEFDDVIALLRSAPVTQLGISVHEMTVNNVANLIIATTGRTEQFEVMQHLKNKDDWKKTIFPDYSAKDDSLVYSGHYASCYVVTEFPGSIKPFMDSFQNFGCPVYVAADFEPLDDDSVSSLERLLELKYNRKIEHKQNHYISMTCLMGFATESDSMRKMLEKALYSKTDHENIGLSPMSMQEETGFNSLLSLGFLDFRAARNVNAGIIHNFIA